MTFHEPTPIDFFEFTPMPEDFTIPTPPMMTIRLVGARILAIFDPDADQNSSE
ncbi:MAG: hypothetical protein AAF658_13635 [Myxococcota bacterium]